MDQEFCFDHVKLEINIIHPDEAVNQGVFSSVEKSGIALKMWCSWYSMELGEIEKGRRVGIKMINKRS